VALTLQRTGAAEYGKYLKVLIAGDPGAGKTRSASTWDAPLIASLGANLMSVADRGTAFVEITSSAELSELREALNHPAAEREALFGFPVNTIVIDTLDHYQEVLIVERKQATKADFTPGDWQWLGDEMAAVVRGFRNLPLHVVFHLHLKLTEDILSGQVYFRPSLVGQMGDKIAAYVDVALAFKGSSLLNEDGSRTLRRWAQTYRDDQHPWIRDNSGQLPAEFEINFEDDFERLFGAVYDGLTLPESGEARVIQVASREVAAPQLPAGQPTAADLKAAQDKGARPAAAKKAPAKVKDALPSGVTRPAGHFAEAAPARQVTDEEAVRAGKTKEDLPANPEFDIDPEVEAEAELVAALSDPDRGVNGSGVSPEQLATAAADTKIEPCSKCGKDIETVDQVDLSMVVYRKPMCRSCFKDAKRSLSASR
jgi:hypothetical protein